MDLLRVLQFVVWTCITVPPNFRWQGWLEKRFPAYHEESGEMSGFGEKGVLPLSEVGIGSLEGEGVSFFFLSILKNLSLQKREEDVLLIIHLSVGGNPK